MSIKRLQELKTRWVNQKKTVSFVEKFPWYNSETFKSLCRSNEYCFALGFIWMTHLNECMGQNELFLNLMVRSIQHYHSKTQDSSYLFPYSHLAKHEGDPLTELNTTATLFLAYEKTISAQSVETNQYFTLTQPDCDTALGADVQYGTFNKVQSLIDMLTEYKHDVMDAIDYVVILNKSASTNSHDQLVMADFVDDQASDCDGDPYSFPKDKLNALQIEESLVEIFEDYKGDIKKAIDTHTNKGMFIITYNNGISHAVSYKKNSDLGKYEFLDTGNLDQPIIDIEKIDDLKSLIINLYDTYMARSTKTYIVFLYFKSCFSSEYNCPDSKKVKLDHLN